MEELSLQSILELADSAFWGFVSKRKAKSTTAAVDLFRKLLIFGERMAFLFLRKGADFGWIVRREGSQRRIGKTCDFSER